jgi:hypothetical protein
MATDGKATWWNATAGAPAYNAQELRQIDTLGVMPGPAAEPFSGRPGRRVNGKGLEVSVSSTGNGSVTVSAGVCLLYSSSFASQGVWRATFPQVGPIALGARPPSGQTRVDLVVARLYDSDPGIGAVKEAKIEVLPGSAGAPGVAPNPPAGAALLVLGQLTVPNSGTITFTQTTQRTVAAGGILPVATPAEREELKTNGIAYEGMYVDVASTDTLERFDGTNWPDTSLIAVGSGGSAPAFQNGWSNLGDPDAPLTFQKIGQDVEISGGIKGGTSTIFQLPPGYWPNPAGASRRRQWTVTSQAGSNARIDIQAGAVTLIGFGTNGSNGSVFIEIKYRARA